MVYRYNGEFSNEGVQNTEMSALLDTIEATLNEIDGQLSNTESVGGLKNLIDGARSNVTTARNVVNAKKGGAS